MRLRLTWTAVAAAFPLLAGSVAAEPRRHAVLVGVGTYTHLPPRTSLEGPPNDVRSLQRTLVEQWGFDPRNVLVLLDAEATRAAILAALDGLAQSTRPGDFIFVYFSGHGTSSYDRQFSQVGIDGNSGALIPADFRPGPPEQLKDGLVIGSRDLRPRLERLDRDRSLFVVFDSCFSGNAARMAFAAGQSRYVVASDLVTPGADARALVHAAELEGPPPSGPPEAPQTAFPYANLVYVSAASKSEKAMDITTIALRSGRVSTVDDRPHGALTNALLEGLAGAADTNRDATITYGELYRFARDQVTGSFPHQPQLLVPAREREALLEAPVLGAARAGGPPRPAATAAAAPGGLRLKLADVSPEVARELRGLPGVTLREGTGAYDVLLTQGPSGFSLYHASGDELASFALSERAAMLERVARQRAVLELIDFSWPDQEVNVALDVPGNRGFLNDREPFVIELAAERDSHLLLLDVDTGGTVSVLYPFSQEETAPVRRVRVPPPPDALRVSPPFGTEYLKLFAFARKPSGFERWVGASFSPTTPDLQALLAMLRSASGPRAQSRLKVVTRAVAR